MDNLPLEYYEDQPYVRKAIIFLKAAETLYKPENRSWDNWEVSYYLISHAIELSIKAVAFKLTGSAPFTHDKIELAEKYKNECKFDEDDLSAISQLKGLNNGKGGLRYVNTIKEEFLPSTFNNAVSIAERLIHDNFQK